MNNSIYKQINEDEKILKEFLQEHESPEEQAIMFELLQIEGVGLKKKDGRWVLTGIRLKTGGKSQ